MPCAATGTATAPKTIGIYRPCEGTFYLRNTNTIGIADVVFPLGAAGDTPLAGDWDGDGIDTPAVFRASSGELIIRATNDPDWSPATHILEPTIPAGAAVFAGDWDGDGTDTIGYHLDGTSRYSNTLGGPKDLSYVWGNNHNPVTGVWAIS